MFFMRMNVGIEPEPRKIMAFFPGDPYRVKRAVAAAYVEQDIHIRNMENWSDREPE